MKTIAIYPGSFDPITFGHLDVINRAVKLFDEVVVGIAQNSQKTPFLAVADRLQIIKQLVDNPKVKVIAFDGLLIDYALKNNISVILRGIRAVSDFEYEFALAGMNKQLSQAIETIFITPNEKYANISSTLVREIFTLGGDITKFVPRQVAEFLATNKV
jgi:pantetheine-phosphate adenylyltransferase